MTYYHIDKSGLVEQNLMQPSGNSSKYMIIGKETINSFPYGFMTVEKERLVPKLIENNIHQLISSFFKNRSIENIDKIINELSLNISIKSDIYIQRVLREIIFELERINNFPIKPSRLSCVYLIDNNNDIQLWKDMLGINGNEYTFYEFEPIEPSKFKIGDFNIKELKHKADAKWLEIGVDNINKIKQNAIQYWKGNLTKSPLNEILYYGILKCKTE